MKRLATLSDNLERMKKKKKAIENELKNGTNYTEKIIELENELLKVDLELYESNDARLK